MRPEAEYGDDRKFGLKIKRPQTSKTMHRNISINEQFNEKLIQHGTNNGIPYNEMPIKSIETKTTNPSKVMSYEPTNASKGKPPKVANRPPSGRLYKQYQFNERLTSNSLRSSATNAPQNIQLQKELM